MIVIDCDCEVSIHFARIVFSWNFYQEVRRTLDFGGGDSSSVVASLNVAYVASAETLIIRSQLDVEIGRKLSVGP